jgi:hypothetical protein
MKIVNIIGGLGNQMFQYAFAIALQNKYSMEIVKVDVSHFKGYGLHNGFETERIFGRNLPIADKNDIKNLSYYIPNYNISRVFRRLLPKRKFEYIEPLEKAFTFDEAALLIDGNCYYEGYWQSPKFFNIYRNQVLSACEFRAFITDENLHLEELIRQNGSVSIHIRRGDYVNASNFKGICDQQYYRSSIEKVKELMKSPRFFIFSNDIGWCRENILDMLVYDEVTFVDNNIGDESYRDMQLMSLAQCNILANSSFSWWAAYLNKRSDAIVITPKKWVNLFDYQDIFIDSWIKL